MAYQFTDSFDHYNTPSLMYDVVGGSPVISSSFVRFPAIAPYPNQGISIPSNGFVQKTLKSNQSTLIVFRSFGADTLPGSGQAPILVCLDNGTVQCTLQVNADGSLQFYRPNPGFSPVALGPPSALGLIAPSIVPNHGIECQFKFSGSVGSVLCYLDGVLVIPLTTGLNTIRTANAYANQVGLGSYSGSGLGSGTMKMSTDYLRVWDATGSYQNAPLGYDVRKLTKLPQGVGALSQWTPNGAASNWQCVDENPPDGDTSYVSSAGNLYDCYAMGSAGFAGAVSQTVAKSYARKDDGVTRALEIGVYSNGNNGLGSPVTMSSSYAFVDTCISVDPNTGLPPTPSAADAFQHLKYEST